MLSPTSPRSLPFQIIQNQVGSRSSSLSRMKSAILPSAFITLNGRITQNFKSLLRMTNPRTGRNRFCNHWESPKSQKPRNQSLIQTNLRWLTSTFQKLLPDGPEKILQFILPSLMQKETGCFSQMPIPVTIHQAPHRRFIMLRVAILSSSRSFPVASQTPFLKN